MKQSLSFFVNLNKKNLINEEVEKNLSTTIRCPSLALVPFVFSYIKKRKVFVLTKKQANDILSYFDYKKETLAIILKKERFSSPGGFISFQNQLFNISKSRCELSWKNIDLCLIQDECFEKPLFNMAIKSKVLKINKGDGLSLEKFIFFLLQNTYNKKRSLEENGDFVVRGGVVDVFPYNRFNCVRVSFLDESGVNLFSFEKESLYSNKPLFSFAFGEKDNKKTTSVKTLSDKECCVVYYKNKGLEIKNKKGEGSKRLDFCFNFFDLSFYKKNRKKIKYFSPLLADFGLTIDKTTYLAPFWFKDSKKTETEKPLSFQSMFVGDYYIHESFGVCSYLGVDSSVDNNEFVCLKFSDGVIKVGVEKLNRLYFLSEQKNTKKLSSLAGKKRWVAKKRGYFNLASLYVDSLAKTYNKRQAATKTPCIADRSLLSMFSSFFPHVLTQDQKTTLKDVFADMFSSKPMSRLVCGDVGFGKTEIALRAAFLAVINNKSVVLLAPTIILADQLFDVFSKRFENFSIPVFSNVGGFLSFGGRGKILVSTHRVLSSPKALSLCGLFIIDEEHRFGVAQKEEILKNNLACDVLYLSATPLPRTLQMSFSKIRNFSLIKTPPTSKKATITNVYVFNKNLIINIIKNEIERGGQVYVVDSSVNNVVSLCSFVALKLSRFSVSFLHSKRGEKTTKKTMSLFRAGKIKVLVSTSIIESGIDIGSVNTIIINNSHCFGLSQLYQLRGRVGRSNVQSFAYYLVPKKAPLSKKYIQRLSSITKNQKLGSGYNVAIDDLNLRGAGSLFGYKQSGGGGVGFDFYTKLISDVFEGRGFSGSSKELSLSLGPAFIPSGFAFSSDERLQIYRAISSCFSVKNLRVYKKNICSVFGRLPGPFLRLFQNRELVLLFKKTCVESLSLKRGLLLIVLNKKSSFYKSSLKASCEKLFMEKKLFPSFISSQTQLKIQLKKTSKDVYILMKLFAEVLVVK